MCCTRDGQLTHQSDEWVRGAEIEEGGEREREKEGEAWEKRRWVKSLDCLQMAVRGGEVLQSPVRAQAVCVNVCVWVCICICVFACLCVQMGLCICVCLSIYLYVVCMHKVCVHAICVCV